MHVVDAPRSITLATPDGRSTYGVKEKVQLKWELDGCEGRVKFATSNSRIATVSAAGLVTFKKTGKVTIKVTAYNGVTASLALTGKTAPKSISLGSMRTQLGLGETAQLKASFPSGSTGSYTFTSSAPEIISVDGVTAAALKVGSATLTVTAYNGKKASRTVTVLPAPESVSLNRNELTIGEGDQFTLTASLNEGSAGAYSFASSNDHVSVNADGTVSALSKGDATVTVTTYNGKTADCLVHVVDAPRSVTLATPDGRTKLGVGEKIQLKWESDGGCAVSLQFKSSNSKVIAVNASGVISVKKAGTATIAARTYNGIICSIKLTAVKAPSAVRLSAERSMLGVGETLTLKTALTSGSAGSIELVSDTPDVLSIDAQGEVTALKVGRASIIASTYNGKRASLEFEVRNAPTAISVSPDPLVLAEGDTAAISAETNAGSAGALHYLSLDTDIAAVDSSGMVTGVKAGRTQIVVSTYVEGVENVIDVEVKPVPTYVKLPWTSINLGVGDTLQLAPETDPDTVTSFSYSGGNSYASVSADGLVTAHEVGNATLTVRTHNGKSCKLYVAVKKAPSAIRLEPASMTLGAGETAYLTPVLPSGSASTLRYESADPTIASVTESGLITAVKTGDTEIIATSHNGKTAVCTVSVKPAPKSISLSGLELLGVGQSVQLQSALSPENSASTIRYSVVSGENVVFVDENGMATALAAGKATLRASTYIPNVYADLNISVKPAPDSVRFAESRYAIDIGQTDFRLSPIIPDGTATSFTYTIKKAGFFTIDETGLITPIMQGNTTVMVTTHNGKTATVEIYIVDPNYPEEIAFAEVPPTYIETNGTYTPIITVFPETAKPRMLWTSSDETIAEVDPETGTVTGVGYGQVVITGVSQANPALQLSFKLAVLGDGKRCLKMPKSDRISKRELSSVKNSIIAVRSSAYQELNDLQTTGKISSSEYSTRKAYISRAFDMQLFAWTTSTTELYWKAANSNNGKKDFKPDYLYFGLPYTQTNRNHNQSSVVSGGYFSANGSSYKMNGSTFADRAYPGNDCSSFVSMAIWGRGKSHSYDNTRAIASATYYKTFTDTENLKPGDILVKSGSHVIMFLYYADKAKTQMVIIEQGGGNDYTNTISCSIKSIQSYLDKGYKMRKVSGLK